MCKSSVVVLPLLPGLVLSERRDFGVPGHGRCNPRWLFVYGDFVTLDGDMVLLRPRRLEDLGILRLRLTKSGRSVTRQAQRMAIAGSS